MSNTQIFWDFFKAKGLNEYGIAGLLGNIWEESGCKSNNLQNSFNKKFNMTDDEYVKAVDEGTYTNFIDDKAGFGLAQWTHNSRKKPFYEFMKKNNYSIGSFEGQLNFLYEELTGRYKSVWQTLQDAKTIREASDVVMLKFEKPANQSEQNQIERCACGQKYYDLYATKQEKKEEVNKMDYSKHTKYIESTGTHYISNSGSDERGKYTGGQAGDQTGGEWNLRSWYNRPWTVVLRYEKDPRVGYLMAQLSCAAALNNNVGYDQIDRTTYWTQLKKVNYDPSAITTKCEEDCTAGVTANTKACGYLLGIEELQKLSTSIYSKTMKSNFTKAGFKALTDSKYLTSTKNLLPGDILLYEGHHAAANVTIGSAMRSSYKKPDISMVKFNGATVTPAPAPAPEVQATPAPAPAQTPTLSSAIEVIGKATAKQDMHVRDSADTFGKSLTIIKKNEQIEVVDLLSNGWMKVKFDGKFGYTSNRNNAYYDYKENAKAYSAKVFGGKLYVRKGPGTDYGTKRVLAQNTKVTVYEEKNNFGRIGEGEWCSLKYLKKC